MKKIPIGEDNFKDLIEKNAYYVDKTEVINESKNYFIMKRKLHYFQDQEDLEKAYYYR